MVVFCRNKTVNNKNSKKKKKEKTITWEKNVRKIYLPRYYNNEIITNTKTKFYTDGKLFELFCFENDLAKYFEQCCTLFIEIFYFAHYNNFLKLYISILQGKSDFRLLYNFTKCFSGTRVNQIVNICLNEWLWMIVLSLEFVIFSLQNWCLQNFSLIKK